MSKTDDTDPLLNRDQRRAIAAFLVFKSIRRVAEHTRIDKGRIRKWLRTDQAFRDALDAATEKAFADGLNVMRLAHGEAAQRLRKLIRSKDPKIALEACKEMLAGGFDADLVLRANHASRSEKGVPEAG